MKRQNGSEFTNSHRVRQSACLERREPRLLLAALCTLVGVGPYPPLGGIDPPALFIFGKDPAVIGAALFANGLGPGDEGQPRWERVLPHARGQGAGGSLCSTCASGAIDCGTSVVGELAANDCRLDDGSYVEIWRFELAVTSTVTTELESAAFDTYVLLADRNCLVLEYNDDCDGAPERSCLTINLPPGEYFLAANSFAPGETGPYALRLDCTSPRPRFARGDVDSNGAINVTDAIRILSFLFTGGNEPECLEAADVDDQGGTRPNITDAIALLNWLFLGGRPPAPPVPREPQYSATSCGMDLEEGLGCETPAEVCNS
jgi:hypothetical protein